MGIHFMSTGLVFAAVSPTLCLCKFLVYSVCSFVFSSAKDITSVYVSLVSADPSICVLNFLVCFLLTAFRVPFTLPRGEDVPRFITMGGRPGVLPTVLGTLHFRNCDFQFL